MICLLWRILALEDLFLRKALGLIATDEHFYQALADRIRKSGG